MEFIAWFYTIQSFMGQTKSRLDPFNDLLLEATYHTLFRTDPAFFETYPYSTNVTLEPCDVPPACDAIPSSVCSLVRNLCGVAELRPEEMVQCHAATGSTIEFARKVVVDELERSVTQWVSMHPDTHDLLRTIPDESVRELRVLMDEVVVPRMQTMLGPGWFESVHRMSQDVIEIHRQAYGFSYLEIKQARAIVRWHMETHPIMHETLRIVRDVLDAHVRSPMLMDRLSSIGRDASAIVLDASPMERLVLLATVVFVASVAYAWYRGVVSSRRIPARLPARFSSSAPIRPRV